MKIYDRVLNRRLGPMIVGNIVGIIDPETRHKFGIGDIEEWDTLYGDWENKLMYLVKLDRPEKHVTKEECGDGYEDIKLCNYLFFPEEDLVLLDDL